MKFMSMIILVSAPLFAMQESLHLDQTALQEFLANKKQMVSVSEGKVNENNLLFKRYVNLSKLDQASTIQEYAQPALQEKIKSFYSWIAALPEYTTALSIAKTVNTQEAWDAFRKGNGPLVQKYFDENGVKTITTSCADFFNGNAHLNAEQVEKVVAQSFVIYYIRQLQRQQTSVTPSTIQIK
jgi:hypothetical protein